MITPDEVTTLILETVGPLSDEEAARLFGRKSRIRAAARDLGVDQHLPEPPPFEQDESLRYAAKDAVRRLRTRAGQRRCRCQAVTTRVRTAEATAGLQETKRHA